jgi:hypothetical protein
LGAPLASSGNADFIAQGAPVTAQCPGSGQAAAGYLCVYEKQQGNRTLGSVFNPSAPTSGVVTGFNVWFTAPGAGGAWSYGDWTLKAP